MLDVEHSPAGRKMIIGASRMDVMSPVSKISNVAHPLKIMQLRMQELRIRQDFDDPMVSQEHSREREIGEAPVNQDRHGSLQEPS